MSPAVRSDLLRGRIVLALLVRGASASFESRLRRNDDKARGRLLNIYASTPYDFAIDNFAVRSTITRLNRPPRTGRRASFPRAFYIPLLAQPRSCVDNV